jgi:hypothetical protein
MPLSLMDKESQTRRVGHTLDVLGRLKPGVNVAAALADMEIIASRLAQVYPATNRNIVFCSFHCEISSWGIETRGPHSPGLRCPGPLYRLRQCGEPAFGAGREQRSRSCGKTGTGSQPLPTVRSISDRDCHALRLWRCVWNGFAALTLPLLRVAFAHTPGADPIDGSIDPAQHTCSAGHLGRLPSHCCFLWLAAIEQGSKCAGRIPASR